MRATTSSHCSRRRETSVSPRFWSMLRDIRRFYAEAPGHIAQMEGVTLGDYLDAHGYGAPFREDHLHPMAAAIWSLPARACRRISGAGLHALLRQSRPAEDYRPPGLAHGRRRQPRICEEADRAGRRACAARTLRCGASPATTMASSSNGRRRAAFRSRGDRRPCRSGACACSPIRPRRKRGCSRAFATAATRRSCTATRR